MASAIDRLRAKLADVANPEEFLDGLGLSSAQCILKDYGKDRGIHPVRSEAQRKAVEKMAAHIKRGGGVVTTSKSTSNTAEGHSDEEPDDDADFDILSHSRVILFEGRVQKRSLNPMVVNHNTMRHMVLFNDAILLCSVHGKYLSSSEVYSINQAFPLDEIGFTPYMVDESGVEDEDEPEGFVINTYGADGRPYQLIAESESDKKIWVEEIESAILSYTSSKAEVTGQSLCPGWAHEKIRGNLLAAAQEGNIQELKYQINRCKALGRAIDETDDYCMTALHWAILSGVSVNVEALVQAGADIDAVNNALNSPLLLAAGSGAVDAFVFLVENGADIHLRNLNDRDALFMMVMYAQDTRAISVMVDLMITHGGDVDAPDSSGSSALHECCSSSITHSIDILVAAGADINRPHSISGLTPLQICCSLEEPHAETIRSVLDQGAFPNPKTSTGLTAMDMILRTFFARHPTARNGEMDLDPLSDKGMSYLDDFAQKCLPSLMEVAKHGGKFAPDNVVGLRKSLVEAIDSATKLWQDAAEPERFKDFVHLAKVSEGHQKWAHDKGDACQLCGDRFTFSLRRHHCRACGALCCDNCSAKRLTRFVDSRNETTEALRICDGCFNRSVFSCQLRQTDLNIMDKALRRASIKPNERHDSTGSGPYKGNTSMLKSSLFNWSGGGSPSAKSSPDKGASSGMGALQAQNAETMQALQERGEKLEQLNDKAARMNDAAAEFQESTAALLRQQKAKQWF